MTVSLGAAGTAVGSQDLTEVIPALAALQGTQLLGPIYRAGTRHKGVTCLGLGWSEPEPAFTPRPLPQSPRAAASRLEGGRTRIIKAAKHRCAEVQRRGPLGREKQVCRSPPAGTS